MRTLAGLTIVVAAVASLAGAGQQSPAPAGDTGRAARFITYSEAKPILERLAPELAASYAATAESGRDAAWREWLIRRNDETRARLEQGQEDSLTNFLLFGTSFTKLPRALNDSSTLGGPQRTAEIVRGRIEDLITGISTPGANERLLFVRDLVARRAIDPTTPSGRERARTYILGILKRNASEVESYARTIETVRARGGAEMAARSTLYRSRGLSSDTSIRPDFAIDRTLSALRADHLLGAGSVRRVAIIGPGLDFTDKAEGYDFYPQQTTQPFMVIDSLLRLGLAPPDGLTLTTMDLSARVNGHLRAAQQRAAGGDGYVLILPRERDGRWTPDLLRFWKEAAGRIGDDTRAMPAPAGVEVRAVRVRPGVLALLQVRDVNIVVERVDPSSGSDRFDLVVATNTLVYYDVLEQSLALANIAAMLRPGGFLLSNNVLVELPSTPIRSIGHTDAIYSDQPDDRDQIVWYRRD
jgi:hypothetical protein